MNEPISDIEEEELRCLFAKFCTFVTLINGKKLNTANVLLHFLKHKQLRKIFKALFDVDTDFESIQLFLRFDSSIHKSKYVMKYLNSACNDSVIR
jgi:uncharacterized protein Usg